MRRDDTRRDPPRYAAERRDEPRRRQTYQVERQAAPGPQYAAPQYAAPQVIERVVQAPRNDEMFQRIDALEGTMHALMDMMRDLQADVQSGRGGGSVSVDVAPDAFIDHVRNVEATFDDRLAALERTVNTIASEGTRNWSQFADRFKAIDKIAAGSSNASGLADLVTEQLVAVTDQVRLSSDRLVRLEQANEKRDSDLQRAWSGIGERLRALDENFAMQKREIQQTLVSSGSSGQNLQSLVSERFQSVRQQLDENRLDLVSGMAQVVEPLTLKMRDIESAAERRQQEGGRQLSGLAERLVGFETLVRSQADSVAKASATHQRDLTEVHEALLKLGNNQKTLSDNLEQWRLEAGGDLGINSNHLELQERGSVRPIELIEQMQGDLANVTQLALADYDQNRRSFKTWLFGTSDVFAGSWRDETAAVRNRLSELRAKRQKA